jgi:stage II sporulation protein E
MNQRTKKDLKQQIKNDKLDISANDYELMARLLDGISKSSQREIGLNNELGDKIVRALCKNGVLLGGAEVTEGEVIQIILTGIDVSRTSCNEAKIKQILEKELSLSLSSPVLEMSGGYAIMTLEAINQRKISVYRGEKSGKEKEISGDVIGHFKGVGSREYLLICDGMGSGSEARLTARLCTDFLEKILKVTSEKELALAMLNNLVRAKNLECSSSIDLLEIDLSTLEGSFVKSGSAPSYVIREGSAYKLQSKTAPVGIMKELDAERLGFSLREGDFCVMVSDGILPPKGNDDWLIKMLEEKDLDIKTLADNIIKRAREKNTSRDDMSVLVCCVE